MCHQLALTRAQLAAVNIYVEVMRAWIVGYHARQTQTLRYRAALETLPSSGPSYFENVLGH